MDTESSTISATDASHYIGPGTHGRRLWTGSSKRYVKEYQRQKIDVIDVIARFYCPLGTKIGRERDRLNNIEPGTTATFRISSSLDYSDVDRVELNTEVDY